MKKVGANDLCRCGSGKKHKKCYSDDDGRRGRRWISTPEETKRIKQFVREMQDDVENAKYTAPPYHEFDLQGHKIRIVGRGIYPEEQIGKLSNNIVEHFKWTILGKKWLEEEERKHAGKRHIILLWLSAWNELRQQSKPPDHRSGERVYLTLTGEAQELIALADDACRVLQTQKRFPEKLRKRLVNHKGFQGARYELAVAATFIKCNFNIEWIDERTGPANKLGKRCEFNAVHKVTGETIAVEAKSRHRKGTLHEEGDAPDISSIQADVHGLYAAAEKKPEGKPFAIFIDVNLPHQPERQGLEKSWVADIKSMLEQHAASKCADPVPFSFLFVTNFALHYKGADVAAQSENLFFYIPEAPNPVTWATFDAIGRAVKEYGRIPGSLSTNSNQPLPVPVSAHHVNVELTVMTHGQSQLMRGAGRTIGQGFRSSHDAPHAEPQPVKIPIVDGTRIKQVLGVWYEPLENADGLDGFARLDVAPRTDEHKNTHFDLLASSRRGGSKETKIRVHILYESY